MPTDEELSDRARRFVLDHLERLGRGELPAVRAQLYFPAQISQRPVDVYLETMASLAPFEAVELTVTAVERRAGKPPAASIWLDVRASCALGERTSLFIVWWYAGPDTLLIATRPTNWVIEARSSAEPERE